MVQWVATKAKLAFQRPKDQRGRDVRSDRFAPRQRDVATMAPASKPSNFKGLGALSLIDEGEMRRCAPSDNNGTFSLALGCLQAPRLLI